MSRIARIVLEGVPYHITQRGNGRQQVFFDESDYRLYLDLLREQAEKSKLTLWAYCLMPNHIHLVAVPSAPDSLAQTLGRTQSRFSQHFNLRTRRCGRVWQERYFSCPLDGDHLWQALAYVERNPQRANLVKVAADYPWSSARARLGFDSDDGLLDLTAWRSRYTAERWRNVLASTIAEEAFGQRLQEASRRGRPLGDDHFIADLEHRCGRRLRPFPVGRPRRCDSDAEISLSLGSHG